MSRIGILYNSKTKVAEELAHAIKSRIGPAHNCWLSSTDDDQTVGESVRGTDVVVTVGGDGTVLRVARLVIPFGIPILGVNMGLVGFMTEIKGSEAVEKVAAFLNSESRVEERSTLNIKLFEFEDAKTPSAEGRALNDVVVSRGSIPRVCHIEIRIDGALLTTYQADGAIVSTATGSTSYALAAGGPIVHPESSDMILVPVSPHLSFRTPLLVNSGRTIELRLLSDPEGILTIDGQIDYPFRRGQVARITRDSKVAKFLRSDNPLSFYANLTKRLRRDQPN